MKMLGRTTPTAVEDDYLELVRAFPLRSLRSQIEHEQAVKILDRLLGRPGGRLSVGERDYADVLGRLINDYGQRTHPFLRERHSPLEILRFLVEQHGMTITALGKILGNKTAASLVFSGRREMSKAHIRCLADHFRVDPGLFI
jgi:antitoxin component HigA of HigAB toxin-antitoxin module